MIDFCKGIKLKRWRHFVVTIFLIPFLLIYIWISSFIIDLITGKNLFLDADLKFFFKKLSNQSNK